MAFSFSRPRPRDIIGWCLLAAAVIFAVYVRVRLREFPLERDEGEFAYAGQLLLHGIPPYKLAYNMKLPGTYMAYAALMAVFGQTIAGVHLGLLAVNVATILLLYRLTRELFDPISAGLAAIFYATASVNPGVLGFAAHATHFVAVFGVAGVYLLWRYLQSGRWLPLVGSGLLLGTAFLMKQQGVFLMVFGGAVVTTHAFVGFVKRGAVAATALEVGSCLRFRPSHFARRRCCRTCSSAYGCGERASSRHSGSGPSRMRGNTWGRSRCNTPGSPSGKTAKARGACDGERRAPVAADAGGDRGRRRSRPLETGPVALRAGLSGLLVFVRMSWLFFPLALFHSDVAGDSHAGGRCLRRVPALVHSLAAAAGGGERAARTPQEAAANVGGPSRRRRRSRRLWFRRRWRWRRQSSGRFVRASWPLSSPEKWYINFELPAELACRLTYTGNPFVEVPVIAAYLEKNMTKDDTLAVLGSEPEIPFYSRRHSATGYIYTYGLMEAQPLAPKMQKDMIDEIEKNNPKYILVVDCRCSWLYNLGSCLDLHNWASRYLREVRSRGSDRTPRPRAAGPAARDQLSLGQVGTVGDARRAMVSQSEGRAGRAGVAGQVRRHSAQSVRGRMYSVGLPA